MTNMSESQITGKVRSFSPEKGFGFIQGSDGKSYFVHVSQVQDRAHLQDGQSVSFYGEPSPKGYKATNVVPGDLPPSPTKVYSPPRNFLWLRGDIPEGMEYVFEIKRGLWFKHRDPNIARARLIQLAEYAGANAMVNIQSVPLTEHAAWSNYMYTVHLITGDAACVMRVSTSQDPEVIAASEEWYQNTSALLEEARQREANQPAYPSFLDQPSTIKLMGKQLMSLFVDIGKYTFRGIKHLTTLIRSALDAKKHS